MLRRYTPQRMLAARPEGDRSSSRRSRASTPYQGHDVLEQARHGQLEVGFVHKGLDELIHKLDVVFNRLVIALDRRRRADRLEPDRDLREERPARARAARDLARRLRHLGVLGALADVGDLPVRADLTSAVLAGKADRDEPDDAREHRDREDRGPELPTFQGERGNAAEQPEQRAGRAGGLLLRTRPWTEGSRWSTTMRVAGDQGDRAQSEAGPEQRRERAKRRNPAAQSRINEPNSITFHGANGRAV